jgi:alpha/beta superfamily hydrolase
MKRIVKGDIPSSTEDLLEGTLQIAEGHNTKHIVAVLLHPYPPLGGNKDNHIITNTSSILAKHGISSLLLNLRGTGKSQGRTSWTGSTECDDVAHVCKWLYEEMEKLGWKETKLLLAGYSYGSAIATNIAGDVGNLAGLISISYPSQVLWALTAFQQQSFFENLESIPQGIPKLFLIGDRDNFSSKKNWKEFLADVPDPKLLTVLEGVDHFYTSQSHVQILMQHIDDWLGENFA